MQSAMERPAFEDALGRTRAFRWLYGAGHYGKSLIWYASELLFAFFLTESCGLPAIDMTIILSLGLCVCGLADLIVGHRLGASVRSLPAAARVQSLGAILTAVFFVLFLCSGMLPMSARLTWALATSVLFRVSFAGYDVAQNAVLGLARLGDHDRSVLSSVRLCGSALATMSISVTAPFLLQDAARFIPFGLILGLVGIASSMAYGLLLRHESAAIPAPIPAAAAPQHRLHVPRALAALLAMAFAMSACNVVFTKLAPYFAAYFLSSTAARMTILVSVGMGGVLGMPIWIRAIDRWTLPAAFRIAAALLVCGTVAFLALGGEKVGQTACAGLLLGFGLNGLNMMLWVAVSDFAARQRGSIDGMAPTRIFGLLTFSTKFSSAMGLMLVGTALARIHYPIEPDGGRWDVLGPMTFSLFFMALLCFFRANRLAPRASLAPAAGSNATRA